MTPAVYEMGLFANIAMRAALSDNMDEVLAVASTLRNRVLKYGKTYSAVLEEISPLRPWPAINHPLLINPQTGLLSVIESIYRNEAPDYTSNHLHKQGALFFFRSVQHQGTGDWFDLNILQKPEEHGLIGTFGFQQFYE